MKISTKAALYNALLFPGWGHFYLKKYKRGAAIMLPVLVCLVSFCWFIIQVAFDIIKAAPLKKGTVDFQAVLKITAESMKALDSQYMIFLLAVIIILWLFSIIDAYLLGKKQLK
jgi:hypothetical protein